MKHLLAAIVSVLVVVAGQQQADPPKPFVGKVVSVADGDTITVLLDKQQHRIRLEGIDAPEGHQDFGSKAKKVLSDKVFGKDVLVKWTRRDKYRRILGHIYLGDRFINLELVQEGMAWHYKQYSKDRALAQAEREAKEAKRGLWAQPNPIPPWEFRKGVAAPGKATAKTIVFVTDKGKKYHLDGCRFLAKSKRAIMLGEAVKQYEPCSVCKPPRLKQEK